MNLPTLFKTELKFYPNQDELAVLKHVKLWQCRSFKITILAITRSNQAEYSGSTEAVIRFASITSP
jgi:hypothetical protein